MGTMLSLNRTLRPALRATLAHRSYSIKDATYHRDPATGKAYTDQGYWVCINDDDIKKYWPKIYERRQIHAKAHAEGVPMHLARFPQATQGLFIFVLLCLCIIFFRLMEPCGEVS